MRIFSETGTGRNAVNSLSVFNKPRLSNLHFSFAPDLDRATFLHSYVTIRARNLSGCALCTKMFMPQLKKKLKINATLINREMLIVTDKHGPLTPGCKREF